MSGPWPSVALRELLRPVSRPEPVLADSTYRILGAHWYGQGLYVKNTATGSSIQADRLYRVEEGDFIYNRLFAWKGSFALALNEHEGTYVSNEFPCFAVNSQRLGGKFLSWYFRRAPAWDEALTFSTGGTPTSRNRLKEDKFLAFKIPLPPLDEQRRIVARIEALAAKIEEANALRRENLETADTLVRARLEAAFRALSEEYGCRQLGDTLAEAGYGTSVRCLGIRLGHSLPVLRIPNVASERVKFEDIKYGHFEHAEADRVIVKAGDLLIVRTNGSLDLVGRCAVVPELPEPMAFASYLIRIRCDPSTMAPEYLQLMLKHLRLHGELTDFARTTAGQYNVSLGRLRRAEIPAAPLSEQRRIVSYLDGLQVKVDMLKRLQVETAAELDAMLPSILAKAFKGEL